MNRIVVPLVSSPARARGFALPSAIFLLVILAGLSAFLVNISLTQNTTSAQDVQGGRAYHAARAGIEWALYLVLDPTNATVVAPASPAWPHMPACAAGVLAIGGFAVTVTCVATAYLEAGNTRSISVYTLTATATLGAPGLPGTVERQVVVSVSKCRTRDGFLPAYECP